mmetsp:Transcript_15140/g.63894  ORF Transcript_15140/g.63894 Transcript_15140/m.63894 type:complete len:218 (+) Transcript_15140:3143-3796(+)
MSSNTSRSDRLEPGSDDHDLFTLSHHLKMADAHVSPAPNPAVATMSPCLIRPSATASAIAMGTLPALVFPYFSMLLTTFSLPRPNFFAAPSIMRWFAWCNTRWSISSEETPALSSDLVNVSGTVRTANLNTSWPFIAMLANEPTPLAAPSLGDVGLAVPHTCDSEVNLEVRFPLPVPSECMSNPRRQQSLGSVVLLNTHAPAPSPNKMHVPRSRQST